MTPSMEPIVGFGGRSSVDAYASAYTDSRDRLVRAAYLIVRDGELAADVVADVFARAYPSWRDGKISDLGGYLYRAVVNASLTAHRRQARQPGFVRPGVDGDHVDQLADRDLVGAALGALTRKQRAVLVLRFYLDLSEADTAASLGIPAGTVKSTTARALDRLRELMKEDTRA
jgi:RNA polymerase sigma factor (sigma-70 family)